MQDSLSVIFLFLNGEIMVKKLIPCLLLLLLLCGGLYAGGGSDSGSTQGAAITTPVGQYPISTTATLRYWLALHANVSPNFVNLGDTPFGRELIRATGVNVRFEHPPSGQGAEALNLMIAAGDDMPDIIEYNWLTMVGGPERYIGDGTILRLNDAIERYAPAFRNYLRSNPDIDRMVRTDNGSYYSFPFIRGHERLLNTQGLMIRKDWLNDLGLQIPQTIDDWYNTLVAFRDRKGATVPFTMAWSNRARMFMPSFGFLNGWYINPATNRVVWGQNQPGYRRWIETMARWYRDGVIDRDIISATGTQITQRMTTGVSGAAVQSVGQGMGVWTDSARQTNPTYELAAVQWPVLNRGDRLQFTIAGVPYNGQDSPAITAKSRNVELAARFLDYGYTPAGHNLYNFGIQGESYTIVNGKQIYTPLVLSGGPNRWPLAQIFAAYNRATGAGPFIQDVGYIDQYFPLPEQQAALATYSFSGVDNFTLPPVTASQAESRELATIMQEINTYVDEKTARWLLGTEAITDASWNDYIATINRMNIDRAIAIQNAALDRFRRR